MELLAAEFVSDVVEVGIEPSKALGVPSDSFGSSGLSGDLFLEGMKAPFVVEDPFGVFELIVEAAFFAMPLDRTMHSFDDLIDAF